MNHKTIPHPWATLLCLGLTLSLAGGVSAEDEFKIEEAKWDDEKARLTVKGEGTEDGLTVTVSNANNFVVIGSDSVDDEKWKVREYGPATIPCRVAAEQSDGQSAERNVEDAPDDCDEGGAPPPPPPPPPSPSGDVSINSTSQNALSGPPVQEQPPLGNSLYRVFAINDLGMHCGDLDTRVSSILPPFNALHAVVIRRGGEPDILTRLDDGVEVVYSAASNPDDPILGGLDASGQPVLSSLLADDTVYKTNFWAPASPGAEPTALAAYRAFYPPGILDAFYPNGGVDILGRGLPAPNTEELYLGSGELTAVQQTMPGREAPYLYNSPQPFQLFTVDQPFFTGLPFGYVAADLNWFEAAGVPAAAFDDFGLENPWPLFRVQAIDSGGTVLASVDTVVPISGEANCQSCHGDPIMDGGNGTATANLAGDPTQSDEDPQYGQVPQVVSEEWAADTNLVRLHDQKHGTSLLAGGPVVCQTCHYTPALDLAHVGPRGPENDTPVNSGNPSNGRDQVKHKSMSNVMHSHHSAPTDADGNPITFNGAQLFPDMPRPDDPTRTEPVVDHLDRYPNASGSDLTVERYVLEATCYQCHPGRRTDCLRGAMANGGMLCQDCHGNMAQVGDDFSRGVTPATPGAFEFVGNFYTDPDQPRVPWANEPGCGSCHTGDVLTTQAGDNDVIAAADGIRLLQAYQVSDPKATPIVPADDRFAENIVPAEHHGTPNPGVGNPMLYRVSKGHGDVFCEACHGATHGIWPNKNPMANDNIAAEQLQGHSGTISECSSCHTGDLGSNLDGPHGMHPIGSAGQKFAGGDHEELAKNSPDACRACHGQNGEGTVLSAMKTDRILECDDNTAFCPNGNSVLFPQGHQAGCTECHDNEL
jgi:hypothetical protein